MPAGAARPAPREGLAMLAKPAAATRSPSRPAIAAVEFALVAPVLLMFIIGMWEVGRLIEVTQILANAAREAARQASAGQLGPSEVTTLVQQYLAREGVPSANAACVIKNKGFAGNPSPADDDPRDATDLDQLQVTVTLPFRDVRIINLPLVTNDATMLSTQATWS